MSSFVSCRMLFDVPVSCVLFVVTLLSVSIKIYLGPGQPTRPCPITFEFVKLCSEGKMLGLETWGSLSQKTFPGGAWSCTPLEACSFTACFGNQWPLIPDTHPPVPYMYIWYVCVMYIISVVLSNSGSLSGWSHAMAWSPDRRCSEGSCKEREKEHTVGPHCFHLWPYWDTSWAGHRVCRGGRTWGEIISLLAICLTDPPSPSDWPTLVSGWPVSQQAEWLRRF